MSTFGQNVRSGCRLLRRRPGFAAAVVLCLGLGIGGVTAVLSVMNGMFIRLMPYEHPDRLVSFTEAGISGKLVSSMPARIYLDWRTQNESFAEMAAYKTHQAHVAWEGWAATQENFQDLRGLTVTPGFFDVLGIHPLIGRVLVPEEKSFEEHPVVVLSHHVWHDVFGADTGILERDVQLAGRMCKVIGVMGPDYRSLPFGEGTANQKVDYWVPAPGSLEHEPIGNLNYSIIARLKPGITVAQAQADVDRLTQSLRESYPQQVPNPLRILVQPLAAKLLGPTRSASLMILAAAAFVLLIACANVINLFVVHSLGRRAEMAVRSALGSSRLRIVRQLIAENMVLVLLGGALGALVARWGVAVLVRIAPRSILGLDQTQMDGRVLAAAMMITFVCGLVIGPVPGLLASRLNLADVLKESGTRATSGLRERWALRLVVVSEIVLAFLLVVGASLLIRSYWQLMQVELGIQPRHILAFRLSGPNVTRRHDEVLDRLRSLPGVELAASTTTAPLTGGGSDLCIVTPLLQEAQQESVSSVSLRTVSLDCFRVFGMQLKYGRCFTAADGGNSSPVVVINEALAQRLWPGENPIGRQMAFGKQSSFASFSDEKYAPREVVGVLRDVRSDGPDREVPLEAYVPFDQRARRFVITSMALRCRVDPEGLRKAVAREVRSVDGSFKIENMSTLEESYSAVTAHRRFLMAMLSVFAAVAFTLAVVGIYGVVAFTVSTRVREMGIRIAFGAQRMDILRLVMKHAMGLILAGVGFGLVGAFSLRKVIASQLFGISPMDPATLAIGILLVVLVPLAACYLPARKAASVDPMVALRHE
jgi:putative ABC transport system permease protein